MVRTPLARLAAIAAFAPAGFGLLAGCTGGDDGPERDGAGGVTAAGVASVFELQAGDCIEPPAPTEDKEVLELTAIPCDTAHTHEVYAVIPYEADDVYPGTQELTTFADGRCLAEFEDYVGVPYDDSTLRFSYLLPSLNSWNDRDDRAVICVIVATDSQISRSARDSGL
ncbi:MAG: septum formation family protein [Acidimicrobiia bacterium]|nr:septum formation family protein [Acidimicrobiia bacterium]